MSRPGIPGAGRGVPSGSGGAGPEHAPPPHGPPWPRPSPSRLPLASELRLSANPRPHCLLISFPFPRPRPPARREAGPLVSPSALAPPLADGPDGDWPALPWAVRSGWGRAGAMAAPGAAGSRKVREGKGERAGLDPCPGPLRQGPHVLGGDEGAWGDPFRRPRIPPARGRALRGRARLVPQPPEGGPGAPCAVLGLSLCPRDVERRERLQRRAARMTGDWSISLTRKGWRGCGCLASRGDD